MIDARLKEYATERQAEIIDAVIEHGGYRPAARELGIHNKTIKKAVAACERKAGLAGYAPDAGVNRPLPHHLKLKGTSALVDERTGDTVLQWYKSTEDKDKTLELIGQIAQSFAESIPPIDTSPAPENAETDIVPWIQIGDAHIGMLAHEAETGAAFNLQIAEQELCAAISELIDDQPPRERCVINDLGDGTHFENTAGITEGHGHQLDCSGRLDSVVAVYTRTFRFIVEKALEKFQHVDVIVNEGNHSRANDKWMPVFLEAAYGHTGRVHVVNNGSVFVPYRMGNTFVMTHHSDKCKPDKLANVMATDYRKHWGETEHHYIDIGHVHHRMSSKEHPGVMVESFNILAPPDQYAHDNGYRSRQSITLIERSKRYGEVGRKLLPIQRVRDAIRERGGEPYTPPGKRVFEV